MKTLDEIYMIGYDAFNYGCSTLDYPKEFEIEQQFWWMRGFADAGQSKRSQMFDTMLAWGKIIDKCMAIFSIMDDQENFEKIKKEIEASPGWSTK